MAYQPAHRTISVLLWRGKAFIPSEGWFKGAHIDMDPVHTVNIDAAEIESSISAVLSVKPVQLPQMSPEEKKQILGSTLRATGARTWNQLYREGLSYAIESSDAGFRLNIPLDGTSQGWLFSSEKNRTFPAGTDLSEIVKVIMIDYRGRKTPGASSGGD